MKKSRKYRQYVGSLRWRRRKRRLIAERGRECQRCKFKGLPLQLHHRTYVRLGAENDQDLELLCEECHKQADLERAYVNAKRTYLRKKYGTVRSSPGLDAEFDRWLRHKQERADVSHV